MKKSNWNTKTNETSHIMFTLYGTRRATIKILKTFYKIYKIKIDFQKSNRFSKIDYPKSFLFLLINAIILILIIIIIVKN